jgi:hypothetical protein
VKVPSRTALLLVLVGEVALASVALVRRPGSASRPDIGPDDPRVAGVFRTLNDRGLGAALDSLERVAAADSAVLRSGHQLVHALGRDAMAPTGAPSVMSECRPIFASGCYHGVVEAFLNARGRIDAPELERMCTGGADNAARPGQTYECMHGLGHGVVGALGLDYAAALRQCNALSRAWYRSSCGEGVFMEAINLEIARLEGGKSPPSAGPRHHGSHEPHLAPASSRLTIDSSDPYSPCDAITDPWAASCWLFQGFVLLRRTGFDAGAALRACDAAPAARVARCYESVGHQLTGLFQRDDGWVVAQCAKGRPSLAPNCAAGATLALNAVDWTGSRTARFCAAVPTGWRETCFAAAAASLAHYASPDDLARFQSTGRSSTASAGR